MTTLTTFDVTEHLDSEEAITSYLDAVLASGNTQLMQTALGDVAKARGMTAVAKEAGMSRESLYKALSPTGNPTFATISKVSQALGYKLTLTQDKAHA